MEAAPTTDMAAVGAARQRFVDALAKLPSHADRPSDERAAPLPCPASEARQLSYANSASLSADGHEIAGGGLSRRRHRKPMATMADDLAATLGRQHRCQHPYMLPAGSCSSVGWDLNVSVCIGV